MVERFNNSHGIMAYIYPKIKKAITSVGSDVIADGHESLNFPADDLKYYAMK